MKKITMLLSNAFLPDPRVAKEAAGLVEAGYEVDIIAWDRLGQLHLEDWRDGYRVERIQSVRTIYGAGIRQMIYTPRFWLEAMRRIRKSLPDVIHCHDLDTLPAGWMIKQLTGAKLVFDAHENYPALMSLYLPTILVWILSLIERLLLKKVDCTITASSVLAKEYIRNGVHPVSVIGNYQSEKLFNSVDLAQVNALHSQLQLSETDLVIAYVGGFSRNRILLPLIEAVSKLVDVQLVLCGDGHQRHQIEAAAQQATNVHYLGWIPADQVPIIYTLADIVYYCLKPDYPGAIYNAPNSLSNAMMAGKPIIANPVGDLGMIVKESGCGILIDPVDPTNICNAINKLRDPVLRDHLGENAHQSARTQYNCGQAISKLVAAYEQLHSG